MSNYFSDPVFLRMLEKPPHEDLPAAVRQWMAIFGKVLTWDDMAWLRSLTRLPLVLKGICHPDDARRAIDGGADAIYCSNHGGRQANGGIAAIDHLPGVVAASADTPVLFDSGVRSGSDVVKALALGARAVGVGRPCLYGLALGGRRTTETDHRPDRGRRHPSGAGSHLRLRRPQRRLRLHRNRPGQGQGGRLDGLTAQAVRPARSSGCTRSCSSGRLAI